MVNASSSACVGCAWEPSPALITEARVCFAIMPGSPERAWRTMMKSVRIACSVSTVSRTDSPLVIDECPTSKLVTSAERRLAATSNEE